MGSYASINYRKKSGEWIIVSQFNHKFLGYIEDEEAEKLNSVKWLIDRDPDLTVSLLNYSYIHTVACMSERDAKIFMEIYADDFKKMYPNLENPLLWDPWPKWRHFSRPEFYLSFD